MILVHLGIGALAMVGVMLMLNYAQKQTLTLAWWQWVLNIAGVLYGVLVLEVVAGFLGEGAPQAALVMGGMMGIVAVIWGVLLKRFVFVVPQRAKE